MSRRTFATVAAAVSLANAIPGLIAPELLASVYGADLDRNGAVLAQLLASSYIGYAVLNWTTRDVTDSTAGRGIGVANSLAWAISAVIWVYAASSGLTSAAGWFGAALTVVFAVGWAYFVFVGRRIGTKAVTALWPR